MTAESHVAVRVARHFNASAERVFDAWLDPELVHKWMAVAGEMAVSNPEMQMPPDQEIVHIEIDARACGSFSFLVRRQGQEIDHIGEYLEIDRPRRLVFTWGIRQEPADTSRVVIDIAPVESGCELTLTHEMDPKWADYASRTEAGWVTMLDGIAATLDLDFGRANPSAS